VDVEGRVEDVQVTVTVGGTIDVPTVSLTSDQALTEDQLVLLLTAGTTSTSQTGGAIAGQQAALLFSERFTRNVSRGLSGLGFDQVDIQPELLSPEADPGARFTFGKDVLPNLRIIYSFGLNSTESQYYEARYRLRLRAEALFAARRFEDGSLEYSAASASGSEAPAPRGEGGQRGRARCRR
jgi:autotransporter translocation and assembly factor TamB